MEDLDRKCNICNHTKARHYCPVGNMDNKDPKFMAGVCKEEECGCKKFEYKDE